MKVGDLVFANGQIAIIVEDCYTGREMEHEDYIRLYYFGSRRFADDYKWSIVPI
jgi:hypothetical protein